MCVCVYTYVCVSECAFLCVDETTEFLPILVGMLSVEKENDASWMLCAVVRNGFLLRGDDRWRYCVYGL